MLFKRPLSQGLVEMSTGAQARAFPDPSRPADAQQPEMPPDTTTEAMLTNRRYDEPGSKRSCFEDSQSLSLFLSLSLGGSLCLNLSTALYFPCLLPLQSTHTHTHTHTHPHAHTHTCTHMRATCVSLFGGKLLVPMTGAFFAAQVEADVPYLQARGCPSGELFCSPR